MATINRGPWTALVDDDGSNLVGTVWNKDKIKTVLLDPSDAAYPTKVILTSTTGAINDWVPAGFTGADTYIHWAGTANAAVTGLQGGLADGQIVTIKNRSTNGSLLTFAHFSANSASQNRIVLLCTSAPTPVAVDGIIQLIYVTAWASWFCIGHDQGAWITAPYSAADYSAAPAMSWSVTAPAVITCSYQLRGRVLAWVIDLRNTTIGGTGTANLIRKIPGGFTTAQSNPAWCQAVVVSTVINGLALVDGVNMNFYQSIASAPWPTGNCHLFTQGAISVT